MQERRRAIVAWSGALAGICLAVVAVTQHVLWLLVPAIVLAVLALVVLLAAGIPDLIGWIRDRERPVPPDQEPQPGFLPTLRTLAVEGRSLQGRITDRGPMVGMPVGLPDRVEGWERTVHAALESRPELCAQFDAAANPGARLVIQPVAQSHARGPQRRILERRYGCESAVLGVLES